MDAKQLDTLYDWFARFVAGYCGETAADQRNYDLKIEHTYKVCGIMKRLAMAEGLLPGDQLLAEAVALCHDVGRFPQYQRYRTFNDPVSVNHAALAVETLKEERVLAPLSPSSRRILLGGVALHNVFLLPAAIDPEILRMAMLIRDADKLDIWRVLIEHFTGDVEDRASAVTWELPETGRCSDQALAEVMAGRMIERRFLETADDFKLLQLSWVFDFNFAESFAILLDADYIDTFAGLLPSQAGCREAVAVVRDYAVQKSRRWSPQ